MRSGPVKIDRLRTGNSQAQDTPQEPVLVIGEVVRWRAEGRKLPGSGEFHCIEIHEISTELLELTQPQLVLSPLVCGTFDCLDVAIILHEAGFKGRYRAMSEDLPNPWLIRSEIQETCPGLDFDIVSLGVTDSQKVN